MLVVVRVASATGLVDGLATDDRKALEAGVAAIERAPVTTPELADALFAAAHVCEDKLADPARALAIYTRLADSFPDAGVAIAAARRRDQLRAQIGTAAPEAKLFAQLHVDADHLPSDEVARRAEALVASAWPGAPDVALWLAEYYRRTQQFADADARYTTVIAKWPGSAQARAAARARAGNALDAHDWDRAEELANALRTTESSDDVIRAELLRAAARGRWRARVYTESWLALALVLAALAASLVEASLRGGARRPALRPPVEVMFLGPISAVIVVASFTAHQSIAPAVLRISIAGVVLAWLSGATLDLLRTRGRQVRARAIAHVLACAIAVVAVAYIALTHDNLIDLLAETVRFGPDA
jgi:hypothetical protein